MTRQDDPMRILVGVDGSEASIESLALVDGIDWPADTAIDIVTVVQPVSPASADPWAAALSWTSMSAHAAAQIDVGLQRHAQDLVDGARARITSSGRRIETAILDGRPAVAILDRAHTTNADLIVVGSRGHSNIETMLLGSVSAEIIDHADRPVLVARRADLKKVVAAVDGSAAAARAARLISDWRIFAETSVLVVSVAPAPPPWWSGLRDMALPDAIEAFDDIAGMSHDHHERLATEMANQIRERDISAEPLQAIGDPAAEIIAAANAWAADLVIMGTRGRTGITRAMLGSVARNVLANVPCSVMVVRHTDGNAMPGPLIT